MCIHQDIPFLHQLEPCHGVVSTSWCTSDGAGCDVGSANWCSQDAVSSHTMGALNYPVRHLNRRTGTSTKPASQPESQSTSKAHETLRMYPYVEQANGLTANRGPWKPHGHNHRESLSCAGLSLTSVLYNNKGETEEDKERGLWSPVNMRLCIAAPGHVNNFCLKSSQRAISWYPCCCLNPKVEDRYIIRGQDI